MIPLFEDIASQKDKTAVLIKKFLIFLGLLVLSDHLIGLTLRIGLDRYYGLDKPCQILCIGHSHMALGVDKVRLEQELKTDVAMYARLGADISNRLAMIRHYLAVHPDSVNMIVYDVDSQLLTGQGLSLNSHKLFYPFMDVPVVREYVRENAVSSEEYWIRRILKLTRFDEATLALSVRGWLNKWTNLKFGKVDVDRLKKDIESGNFRKISFDPEPMRLFEETVRFVRSRGIRLTLVYIPTIDLMNRAEPEKFEKAIRYFQSFAEKDDGVAFMDYNPEFSHLHEIFYDPIHLNPAGQKLVTKKLADDMIKLKIKINP